jgi:hypothetical protein
MSQGNYRGGTERGNRAGISWFTMRPWRGASMPWPDSLGLPHSACPSKILCTVFTIGPHLSNPSAIVKAKNATEMLPISTKIHVLLSTRGSNPCPSFSFIRVRQCSSVVMKFLQANSKEFKAIQRNSKQIETPLPPVTHEALTQSALAAKPLSTPQAGFDFASRSTGPML